MTTASPFTLTNCIVISLDMVMRHVDYCLYGVLCLCSSFQSNTLTTSNGEVAPESTCKRIKSQFNCANVAGMTSPDVGLSSGDVAVVKNEVISLPGVPDNTISRYLSASF